METGKCRRRGAAPEFNEECFEPMTESRKPTKRADYRPPDYLIDAVDLDFRLDPERTVVKSSLSVRRAPQTAAGAPLTLNGEDLELLSLRLDGAVLPPGRYSTDDKTLTLSNPPAAFTLAVETAISPAANTALSGLYVSSGMLCTQCEAEGFRRMTYFLDRPDVLARYSVRLEADRAKFPVLLSNGNRVGEGALEGARHYTRWSDPFPKPSYLFALVAGDLTPLEDAFTTMSGRKVQLRVFVQPQNREKCGYTLGALKRAMRWDEETFGREYDLDLFMIVAVDHFNFGAMENKGLNIFNSAYVLASPQTATDGDYEAIEGIVAHEYFHNWSGNRVTCRDWFQLCLKEGFTVFRDQEFSSDMRSRPVQRIRQVRKLWSQQFPEDAGPLAHPPRPDQYMTIDNFYTPTVYEKGAEIVRMMKTILGPEKFRAGCDLYFARHDGEAATVEDLVKAMEDAGGKDLAQFRRWYSDAGTPLISVCEERTPDGGVKLTLRQETRATPGQADKPPRHIPIAYSVIGATSGAIRDRGLIELRRESETFEFAAPGERMIVSLLSGFSAPVTLDRELSIDDRLLLAAADEDLFNRWAQTESLWRDLSLAFADAKPFVQPEAGLAKFADTLKSSLARSNDAALSAELLRCPSEADLARHMESIDPEALASGRRTVRRRLALALKTDLKAIYRRLAVDAPYEPTAQQAGERALKNASLSLLVEAGEHQLALDQAINASNMTDEAAATSILALSGSALKDDALERFYGRWKSDPLVVNKWFAWRVMAPGDQGLAEARGLLRHEAYDASNPNNVRAVLAAFARENLEGFNREDGAGYEFYVEQILQIDRRNPQLAARLTTVLENWRKFEPIRRKRLHEALERLAKERGISNNLSEIAGRLLGFDA